MNSQVCSCAVFGIDGHPVTVEVDFRAGLPSFTIVGLPDTGVRESKERVIAAIRNAGFGFPLQRITVNLAPGHIKKEGPSFDLPIAMGILASAGLIEVDRLAAFGFLGELGLDGDIRAVRGVLPCAIGLKKAGVEGLVLPERNAKEAALVDGLAVYPVGSLQEAVELVTKELRPAPFSIDRETVFQKSKQYGIDLSDVRGQIVAKRALEIAASGGHNILLLGPPGSGKTLLARRLPTILPDLEFEEALETTKIHSVAGTLREAGGLIATRPFRSPHHQSSDVALIGGGANPRPGEVSLAHRGVLFLDEFPEFGRSVIESLRQPLEDRSVTVVRVAGAVTYPADFLLVAAANPCPCGYLGSQGRACSCANSALQKYRAKLSGPLIDRIDMHVEVPALKIEEMSEEAGGGEPSAPVRERVAQARSRQRARFRSHGLDHLFENAQMTVRQVRQFCPLARDARDVLRHAVRTLGFSARAYDRILRVARTVADLEGVDGIETRHLAEAIGYRVLDRQPSTI